MATPPPPNTSDHKARSDETISASANRTTAYDIFREQAFGTASPDEAVGFYNRWAHRYNEFVSQGGYCGPASTAAVVSDIISDKSSRILDAASGTGMVGEELKVRGFTCIDALDPSQESLDKSKELHAYTEYICDTLGKHRTEIADDYYDAVVMCGAFGVPHHVNEECFPELIRIAKPGGYIIFTLSEKPMEHSDAKMEEALQALCKQGLWEVVEYRWIPYLSSDHLNEKAKVPILRVLKDEVKQMSMCD